MALVEWQRPGRRDLVRSSWRMGGRSMSKITTVPRRQVQEAQRDMTKMPRVLGASGEMVPSMMVRMRCEGCEKDHRMLVGSDTPLGLLPDICKRTFKCDCRRHIPTITKMDRSLMSVNGVPFKELAAMSGHKGE